MSDQKEEGRDKVRYCLRSQGIQSLLKDSITLNTAFSSHYSTLLSTVQLDTIRPYTFNAFILIHYLTSFGY